MAKKGKLLDDKTIHEILKPYAYKAFKDLSNESHSAIEEFYRDYKPHFYSRTYGMKNLFRPEIKKTKQGYDVIFTYSVDYLTTEHESDEAVFDGSFVHGWHGGRYAWGNIKRFTPRMKPSPWERIENFVDNYKF